MIQIFPRRIASILISMGLLASQAVFGCSSDGRSGFVEENDLYVGVKDKNTNSMTEERFSDLIDRVADLYTPIVKKKGAKLIFQKNWKSGVVNAYARQKGRVWEVAMFGGLARHKAVTEDGFTLVVCHELGHHLGGAPKKKGWFSTSWASNEGQSDYFGSLKCLRRVFENDDNAEIIANMTVPDVVTESCKDQFEEENEYNICIRSAMAGHSLGSLFKALRKLKKDLDFSNPDTKVVKKTYHGHPAPQCRLDTYFQGALCNQNPYKDVDNKDPSIGTCMRNTGTVGVRPLCWYKPSTTTTPPKPPKEDL